MLEFTTSGTVTASALSHVSGIERVRLAASGTNAITLTDALVGTALNHVVAVTGGSGGDTIDGSGLAAGNAIDVTAGSGADTLLGGAGNDYFRFAADALFSTDQVVGGAGFDTLVLTTAGTVRLAGVTGIEAIRLANGANTVRIDDAQVASAQGAVLKIIGDAGGDSIDASRLTGANAVDISSGGGDDALIGGAGDDLFRFATPTLFSTDSVTGGAGLDTLVLSGAGSANLANIRGVEALRLDSDGIAVALSDAVVSSATGARIAVAGSAGNDAVDGHKLTGVNALDIVAGAGDDTLSGGAGADSFAFRTADLTAADTVAGGGGIDTLRLLTSGALAAGALAGVTGVEQIQFANGSTAISLSDAQFASLGGHVITVKAGSGSDVVDGSAITAANQLDISAGSGNDSLTGGAGNDIFRFAATGLNGGDHVDGGGGTDTLAFATAGTIDLSTSRSIEQISLAAGANQLVLDDAFVGSSSTGALRIDGNSSNDTIDLRAVTSSTTNLRLFAGSGDDTVLLGPNGLAATAIYGGAGIDTVDASAVGTVSIGGDIETVLLGDASGTVTIMTTYDANGTITIRGGAGDTTLIVGSMVAPRLDVFAGGGTDTSTPTSPPRPSISGRRTSLRPIR